MAAGRRRSPARSGLHAGEHDGSLIEAGDASRNDFVDHPAVHLGVAGDGALLQLAG